MVENKIVISKKRRGGPDFCCVSKTHRWRRHSWAAGGGEKKKNWKRKNQKPFKLLHFTEVCHCGQEKKSFVCVCVSVLAKSVFRFFSRPSWSYFGHPWQNVIRHEPNQLAADNRPWWFLGWVGWVGGGGSMQWLIERGPLCASCTR